MIKGVLFDFSGTLFRIVSTREWLDGALDELGLELPESEAAELAGRLERAGALPGGAEPQEVPERLRPLWQERDLDAFAHRAAFTALSEVAGPLPDPRLAERLYERHMDPESWRPYPDAEAVLKELHRRGIRIGVLSNIGWDLRPVLRHHGVDHLVDAYVLSYEHGAQKPDPRLFQVGCDALRLAPAQVLMVGDDLTKDAGATALGCAFLPVDHVPVTDRPDALTRVLDLLDGQEGLD